MVNISVLGLGEAGTIFAGDLGKVATVTGFDPYWNGSADGFSIAATAQDCVEHADIVIALTAGSDALGLMESVVGAVPASAVYADLSSSSPSLKESLGRLAASHGFRFADTVLLSPVPRLRIGTPAQASGSGAEALADAVNPLGMDVEAISQRAGEAAARKLLRSIVVKGLTALLIESLRAAEDQGMLDWFSDHIDEALTTIDTPFLVRLLEGTAGHSDRRIHEMIAAAEMIESAGGTAAMTRATVDVLRSAVDGIPRGGTLT